MAKRFVSKERVCYLSAEAHVATGTADKPVVSDKKGIGWNNRHVELTLGLLTTV